MPPFRLAFYGLTSAALALVAYTFVREPPPLWVSIAAFTAYGAFVTTSVLLLRMRVFVDALVRGPRDARGVVLTFDDGPDPETTPQVLAALEKRGARGAFFVIGKKAEAHPELVRAMKARGHIVALHSYAHDRLFSLKNEKTVRADLEKAIATLETLLGERPTLFRPPIGHTNPVIARVCDELGLDVIGWSVSARDGTGRAREDACLGRVARGLEDGAIVLMHDAAERGDRAPLAPKLLPKVLDEIERRNLTVVPLTDFVRATS